MGTTPTGGSAGNSNLTTPSPPLTPGSSQLQPTSSYSAPVNQIHHGEYHPSSFTWAPATAATATVNPGQYAGQSYNAYHQAPYSGEYYQAQISHMHHSPQTNYHHHHPQYHPNMALTSSMSHLTSHHVNPAGANDMAVGATSADADGYVLPDQRYPTMA